MAADPSTTPQRGHAAGVRGEGAGPESAAPVVSVKRGWGRLASVGAVIGVPVLFYGAAVELLPPQWFTDNSPLRVMAGLIATVVCLAGTILLGVTWRSRDATSPPPRSKGMRRGGAKAARPPLGDSPAVIASEAEQCLVGCLARVGDAGPDGPAWVGWQRRLDEPAKEYVSAIATAYGADIVLTLGTPVREVSRQKLLRTLLDGQCTTGGWAARTQGPQQARPEATAWVLSVAARLGLEDGQREELTGLLETMLHADRDPVGRRSTSVVTAVIECLSRVAPRSPLLPTLVDELAAAAQRDGGADPECWGAGLNAASAPTAHHTGRAVSALHAAARALGSAGDGHRALIERGRNWLARQQDLPLSLEEIRRVTPDRSEKLYLQHFTPALAAAALLSDEPRAAHVQAARRATQLVRAAHDGAVWQWANTKEKPVWMTQQALTAIRTYALRGLPWPP